MKGIYTQQRSPYYWLRYYDQLEPEADKKRKSLNTKITITPADKKRIAEARKNGQKVQLQGTPDLRKLLKEFRAGLNERNIEAKSGVKIKKSLLFSEGVKEYLFYKPKLKKSTVDMYNYAANQMIEACGDKKINRYTKKDYTLLIRHCQNQKLSEATSAIITRHLHPLWNYFVKNSYALDNIIIKLKTPKGIPKPIHPKELRTILKYYQDKGIAKQENTVLFLLFTGMRPSSAVVQDWEWIDLENEMMTVFNVKSNRFFLFPIHSELKKLLIKIGVKNKGLVLGYKATDSLGFFKRDMHKLAISDLISTEYSLYNLRDTFASYLANKDVDVSNVQELLNHSDIRITQGHYVKMQTKYLKKKIDKVDFKEIIRQRDIYEQIDEDLEDMN